MSIASAEGHGDTAVYLLQSGAEADKKDLDGQLAIDLAPDDKVYRESDSTKTII